MCRVSTHGFSICLKAGNKLLVVRIICIYSIEVIFFFNLRFLHRLGQVVVVL